MISWPIVALTLQHTLDYPLKTTAIRSSVLQGFNYFAFEKMPTVRLLYVSASIGLWYDAQVTFTVKKPGTYL